MPEVGFEPMITASERLKTVHALNHSATVTGFQRTARRYFPGSSTLHNHRCENLKSYRISVCSPLNIRDKVLHTYRTRCKIIVLYSLIVTALGSSRKGSCNAVKLFIFEQVKRISS
jgi:hypothetical protein